MAEQPSARDKRRQARADAVWELARNLGVAQATAPVGETPAPAMDVEAPNPAPSATAAAPPAPAMDVEAPNPAPSAAAAAAAIPTVACAHTQQVKEYA